MNKQKVKQFETKYGLVIVSENEAGQVYMATWTARGSNFVRAFLPFDRACDEGQKFLDRVGMGIYV